MKLSEFIVLDENEKAKTIIHEGVLVAKRKDAPLVRFLFQMDHYYVEMRCNAHDKSITDFYAYTDPTALTPFLEQIPLRDML